VQQPQLQQVYIALNGRAYRSIFLALFAALAVRPWATTSQFFPQASTAAWNLLIAFDFSVFAGDASVSRFRVIAADPDALSGSIDLGEYDGMFHGLKIALEDLKLCTMSWIKRESEAAEIVEEEWARLPDWEYEAMT
jgi:hypothetical protein